ncbi:tRNA (N6-threonylcarbamoyladenosine(37)-N6)-methyltransferase TrmO [Candidatus Bathyarchaeota archaeon]|jgi:tRNA-Thr(GGU) m(6)t(6)A37 methyltransferase TsaA|nr:tRNA (N6-threonylcarbamoyladenosine(37)-N6)-methyltransferase TrmO [Candidatus Bathyarchaeota archaeon]
MDIGTVRFIGRVIEVEEDISKVKIYQEYCPGLLRIENFSHLIVLYWFHERDNDEHRSTLQVYPRRHKVETLTGVYACRSPSRPNPIGHTIVELLQVNECTLIVKGLDALQDSPVIDIKPYHPRSDSIPEAVYPSWTERGSKT